jgi:ssDNA-binding Zn-finger/Zn-ribbon topoisomerase 1
MREKTNRQYQRCPKCGDNDKIFEGPEGGGFIHILCVRCGRWFLG